MRRLTWTLPAAAFTAWAFTAALGATGGTVPDAAMTGDVAAVRTLLKAGADIIVTNTFISNSVSQADYQTQHLAYEINRRGAEIAKLAAADFEREHSSPPRFVAGALHCR